LQIVSLNAADIPKQYRAKPGEYLKLSVQDTGKGMDTATQERVFDLFFTTKEVNEGTGLGLATVQAIVKNFGGVIKLKSAPGLGATFELYFPAMKQLREPQSTTEIATGDLPRGTESVLLVDDDPGILTFGETMLKSLGYQVSSFADSVKALAKFQQSPDRFQLLITDQTMPDLTGEELIKRVREIRPAFPAVLCTGFSNLINEEKARRSGINAFLHKPFELRRLAEEVRECLDGVDCNA
jgi:CheY-like chemotaxis protein